MSTSSALLISPLISQRKGPMRKKAEISFTCLEEEKIPDSKLLSGVEYKEFYGESNWNDTLPEPRLVVALRNMTHSSSEVHMLGH